MRTLTRVTASVAALALVSGWLLLPTSRDPEEAALTFSAPVLSIIPTDGEEFAVEIHVHLLAHHQNPVVVPVENYAI